MKYDYFISYCKETKDIARYIFFKLTDIGFHIWFDDKDIKLSSNIEDTILSGLEHSDYVIAIISPHYLQSSWPVQELELSLKREQKENRNILIPFFYKIEIDNAGKDISKLFLKSYHMIKADISEESDLWLAKIISLFFVDSAINIAVNYNDIGQNRDDIRTLLAFSNVCQAKEENNNFQIVNLYNLGLYALYLYLKNGATITQKICIAHNYLKCIFNDACNYWIPISHFHTIACRKCVNIILDNLSQCYSKKE